MERRDFLAAGLLSGAAVGSAGCASLARMGTTGVRSGCRARVTDMVVPFLGKSGVAGAAGGPRWAGGLRLLLGGELRLGKIR